LISVPGGLVSSSLNAGSDAVEYRRDLSRCHAQHRDVEEHEVHWRVQHHAHALADVVGEDASEPPVQARQSERPARRRVLIDHEHTIHRYLASTSDLGRSHGSARKWSATPGASQSTGFSQAACPESCDVGHCARTAVPLRR